MDLYIEVCARCGTGEQWHAGKDHGYERGGHTRVETQPRGASFEDREIGPATERYVTLEDRLRVTIINALAGVEVDIGVRMQLTDGQIIPMVFPLFPVNTRTVQVFDINLAEGYLLSVDAATPTAAVRRGQCFVNMSLVRGTTAAAQGLYDLTEGYVVTGNDLGWPEPDSSTSVDGPGNATTVQQNNPAAGADWSMTVPVGARWRVRSLAATLTTSAAVANRLPVLAVLDAAGHVIYATPPSTNAVASTAYTFSWGAGVGYQSNANVFTAPLPVDLMLLQGWKIVTQTTLIQAADQWSAIWANVEEWMEP